MMTTNRASTPWPYTRRAAACVVMFPRTALALAALAALACGALQGGGVAPLASRTAVHPLVAVNELAPHLKQAPRQVIVDDQEDGQDEQDAEDGPPAEPVLEQIPVMPASEPESVRVSGHTIGGAAPVDRGNWRGRSDRESARGAMGPRSMF